MRTFFSPPLFLSLFLDETFCSLNMPIIRLNENYVTYLSLFKYRYCIDYGRIYCLQNICISRFSRSLLVWKAAILFNDASSTLQRSQPTWTTVGYTRGDTITSAKIQKFPESMRPLKVSSRSIVVDVSLKTPTVLYLIRDVLDLLFVQFSIYFI